MISSSFLEELLQDDLLFVSPVILLRDVIFPEKCNSLSPEFFDGTKNKLDSSLLLSVLHAQSSELLEDDDSLLKEFPCTGTSISLSSSF